MESNTVRQKYLDFFSAPERGHAMIPSASLVPQNDPTTLFTGSGMQPLLPYLLGKKHPKGTRLVDSQKCFRAEDIEEVGDNRHTTFFEMLGNWSLGDYFKKEQLPWFFAFLTKEIGIPQERLWVTCFAGDEELGLPRDDESAKIWKQLGIPHERIYFYGSDKNWWSRVGAPQNMPEGEPGGPDSEVFYEFTQVAHDPAFGEKCHPNCDCGRFLEIGNSVFMEYIKTADGFEKLPQQNVDFGGGLERLVAAANDEPDVFKIDTLNAIIEPIQKQTGATYADNVEAYRIIADHMRAAVFMIADGVTPSNTEQGYFVRRLLRRSILHSDKLGVPEGELQKIVLEIGSQYKSAYPELENLKTDIAETIAQEEERFRKTLSQGLKQFNWFTREIVDGQTGKSELPPQIVFDLYQTYGFPFELTEEVATERGLFVDRKEFDRRMTEHQKLSRAGAEKRFKGGLADSGEKTTRLHTAHHLLLKALQEVLGEHVKQRGSNITSERLRIDFSHGEKMTDEQKTEVERMVNEKIQEGLPVVTTEMPYEKAEKLGAEQEFGQKYPDVVTVYSIGPKGASAEDPKFNEAFSIEFCGGPHVENTAEIGKSGTFKIKKEEASAAGIRRIKGVLQ